MPRDQGTSDRLSKLLQQLISIHDGESNGVMKRYRGVLVSLGAAAGPRISKLFFQRA